MADLRLPLTGFAAAAIAILAVSVAVPAAAAPPPPLPHGVVALHDNFFAAMPHSFPADVSAVEQFVSPDVQISFDGEIRFSSRDEWFSWLQSMSVENNVERLSMSREEFFFQSGDRIMVREFWFPFREGVTYHPEFPHKMVSYQFKDLKLVKVDYGASLRPMRKKLGVKADG